MHNEWRALNFVKGVPLEKTSLDLFAEGLVSNWSSFVGMALACLPLAAAADDLVKVPIRPPRAAAVSKVQNLVFLGATRPVLLRVQVRIGDKPCQEAWEGFIQQLFRAFDRNGDGVLSREEASHLPSTPFLLQLYQGALNQQQVPPSSPAFRELDANPSDGYVTFRELTDYYRRTGFAPIRLEAGPKLDQADKLTDTLFNRLDRNGDGKLSKDELAAAASILMPLDMDDDELIGAAELMPRVEEPYAGVNNPSMNVPAAAPPEDSLFLLETPGEPPRRLLRQILAHYDKNENRTLSRAEIGLSAARFQQLDRDRNGELDEEELGRWLEGTADLELIVHLGGTRNEASIEVVEHTGQAAPLGAALSKHNAGVPTWTLGDAQLGLRALAGGRGGTEGAKQFLLQLFQTADANADGFLERREVRPTQFQALRVLLTLADRDADGRLSEKELSAYFDLLAQGEASYAVLTVGDHGRGLFELLDADHDEHLSQRELRSAWNRLAVWDRGGVGALARAEIPRQYQLTFSSGKLSGSVPFPNFAFSLGSGGARQAAAGKGPLWFRKMDRNGDGDVSLREFLGTLEDFRRIDADGDGLIDAQEAERADLWFRERLRKKSSRP